MDGLPEILTHHRARLPLEQSEELVLLLKFILDAVLEGHRDAVFGNLDSLRPLGALPGDAIAKAVGHRRGWLLFTVEQSVERTSVGGRQFGFRYVSLALEVGAWQTEACQAPNTLDVQAVHALHLSR